MPNIWVKDHFVQKLYSNTELDAGPTALPGPLKWSVKPKYTNAEITVT